MNEILNQILTYVKPELVIVSVVLYFAGKELKKSGLIKEQYGPLLLGAAGILLSTVWVLSTCPLDTRQDIFTAVFTAVVQGILVAGLSTWVDRILQQIKKKE